VYSVNECCEHVIVKHDVTGLQCQPSTIQDSLDSGQSIK